MKQNREFHDVITGMAQLGEIYLRINGKIQAMYGKMPRLKYEAGKLMALLGYEGTGYDLHALVDTLLKENSSLPVSPGERQLLYRYRTCKYYEYKGTSFLWLCEAGGSNIA